MNYAVVIPARRASSRLPNKPLIDLCGIPMIIRTYQQCVQAAPADKVIVATDDDLIRDICESHGIRTIMTSSNCLTGTDRVAEAAGQLQADTFINVQGDEPLFNPDDLRLLIEAAAASPESVINGYCPISDLDDFKSPSIPKVVFRPDGRLLYMSRAAIPTGKSLKFHSAWRQVCAYAFPRKALFEFSSAPEKTPLEHIEDIEILRFLELGWDVKMIEMSDHSIAVDLPVDVMRVEDAIRSLHPSSSHHG